MELFVPIRKVGRYKKKKKRQKLYTLMLIAVAALPAWLLISEIRKNWDKPSETITDAIDESSVFTPRDYLLSFAHPDHTRYASYFNDEQDVQIIAAEEMGAPPGTPLSEGRYVLLHSTSRYYLHDVSYPYLTPEAADLLNKIGEMYQSELGNPQSRLRVTSCLRTPESVKKLQRRNVNAVENSCHLYGTTFDISYSRMEPHEKRALAKVLSILRESGYCYVKHERKQPCFHITVRK